MVRKVRKLGLKKASTAPAKRPTVKSKAKRARKQPTLDDALAIMRKHYGYENFSKAQSAIIEQVLSGSDVLGILPTGGGKSMTFIAPAMLLKGLTLVISPLIALMKDQVDNLAKRGIPAAAINSHIDESERREIENDIVDGKIRILYVAPERFSSSIFMRWLKNIPVSLVAVDECHCVSSYGHDFRPAYSNIQTIFDTVRTPRGTRPACLALTATLPLDIEDKVAHGIGLDSAYYRIVGDPIRPNFAYRVIHCPLNELHHRLLRRVETWDVTTGRYIVYVGRVKECDPVANRIRSRMGWAGDPADQSDEAKDRRLQCATYNGKMKHRERTALQERFTNGQSPIVVATCAFGMGIDIPNVREIVHLGIKGSLEDYVQEAGRAGRDGLPA
ncbi:MAG: hypothetical protein DRP42_06775, partial [Tenericutes bacterium]